MSEAVIEHPATPTLAKSANVLAKGALVLLLVFAVAYPDQANLRDKAAGMRAIGYPLVSFTVPGAVVDAVARPDRRSRGCPTC